MTRRRRICIGLTLALLMLVINPASKGGGAAFN
jgi:hypothetical protein